MYVSADQALPFDWLLSFPDHVFLDALTHKVEAFFVVLLHLGYLAETSGDFFESFFFGHLGEPAVMVHSLFMILFR